VLLGLLVILFLAKVYNPFEEGIGDRQLLVLAPADADALVYVPRVAKFLGELRDRPFSQALAKSDGFQRFLHSEFARDTGAVEALSSAFSQLDLLRGRPPLGLDLWDDIAGESLLFAGYAPTAPAEPWHFIAMFRPGSWKVIAAVNVLIDEMLGDLGPIRNGLTSAGVTKVTRFRDSVTLEFARGPALSVARIRNVVILGTEGERITRLKTTIERDRLPISPPARYADLVPESDASPYEVRAVAKRHVVDSQLRLSNRLVEKWGRENVNLLESALPRFGGDDLLLALSIDGALDLRLRMREGGARQYDLARSFRRFDREDASLAFRQAAPLFPDSTYAYSYLEVDVVQFLDAFFQRPELFSPADHSNLSEALKSVEALKDLNGLKNKLASICDGKVGIGFFKQDREVLDKAATGYFVAWHLQDQKGLDGLLASISKAIREQGQSGSRSGVRDLVHRENRKAGIDLYEIVLPAGVVDDVRVTKLGLVVGREMLLITNFIDSFRPLMDLGSLDERILPAEQVLDSVLERGPDTMRVGVSIAADAMYQFFDQAREGWAVQQTTPTARMEMEWNAQASSDAIARNLKPGTPEYTRFVDDSYQRELDKLIRVKRPEIRREIERYLSDLRGVFRSLGFFIGERDGVELELRLEPAASPE
jgi:hypothetical protein